LAQGVVFLFCGFSYSLPFLRDGYAVLGSCCLGGLRCSHNNNNPDALGFIGLV